LVWQSRSHITTDSIIVTPSGSLNSFGGKNYASCFNAALDKEIVRSDLFVIEGEDEKSAEEKDICEISTNVRSTTDDNNGSSNCEINTKWNFLEPNEMLSSSDYLCVVPVSEIQNLKDKFHEHAFEHQVLYLGR